MIMNRTSHLDLIHHTQNSQTFAANEMYIHRSTITSDANIVYTIKLVHLSMSSSKLSSFSSLQDYLQNILASRWKLSDLSLSWKEKWRHLTVFELTRSHGCSSLWALCLDWRRKMNILSSSRSTFRCTREERSADSSQFCSHCSNDTLQNCWNDFEKQFQFFRFHLHYYSLQIQWIWRTTRSKAFNNSRRVKNLRISRLSLFLQKLFDAQRKQMKQ